MNTFNNTLNYKKILSNILVFNLIILFTVVFCVSCSKLDVPNGTPHCIKAKIRQISNEQKTNSGIEVWRYKYNGIDVYYFTPKCCDQYSDLYDSKCNLICHPDGGFTGGGDGNCNDFFKNRSEGKMIWKND